MLQIRSLNGFQSYLSLASRNALAKGLCFIFRAVICEENRTVSALNIDGFHLVDVITFSTTDLFVLISGNSDELRFGERLAADHLLDASDLHDVYPRLVFVQRIQHDLWNQNYKSVVLFILRRKGWSSVLGFFFVRSSVILLTHVIYSVLLKY